MTMRDDVLSGAAPEASRRTSRSQGDSLAETAAQSGIGLVCLALVAIPLVPLILQAFSAVPLYAWDGAFTLANFSNLFGLPEISKLAAVTLIFCVISIGFSVVFGTVLAQLVGRTNLPARGDIANNHLWPILL